jgi:hypothetical protein
MSFLRPHGATNTRHDARGIISVPAARWTLYSNFTGRQGSLHCGPSALGDGGSYFPFARSVFFARTAPFFLRSGNQRRRR